ncbi:MAG: pyridoxal-phosphate dependent enzyme, partial [Actinomycetota bacterium]|nr:pyridoxal-phosphate dependent enzyme [Actinomycetota bacterium]
GQVRVDHGRVGGGYGAPTEECRQAVLLAARSEGLLLDPVYTGKAMAGLIAARADGSIGPATRTVFLHTGGLPALFAAPYAGWGRDPGPALAD